MDLEKPVGQQISNGLGNITNSISSATANLGESLSDVKGSINSTLSDFSSKNVVDAGNGFLQSNSIIAKFVFLLLVLLVFVFLLNLGIRLIGFFTSPSRSPYIVQGMIDGTYSMTITQDPKNTDSVAIYRSNNETTGLEFTWSVWLRLDSPLPTTTKYAPIFIKGDGEYNGDNISSVNNAPGVYFKGTDSANTNTLNILIDTVGLAGSSTPPTNVIEVPNVPFQKWFHLAIRAQNKYIDVYFNGSVAKRHKLDNVIKQNFNNIRVCGSGGFPGKLSNLRYFDHALSVVNINGIVTAGPNISPNTQFGSVGNSGVSYLSNLWYNKLM